MLDGIIFDNSFFYPFAVTVGCVRAKASVRPHISDYIIMNVVVKRETLEFIGCIHTKNWMVLCELHQNWS